MTEINTEINKIIDSPPEILYKYINWDNNFHKRLITIPETYFAPIEKFNDPYDCGVSPHYDHWTETDWINTWCRILTKRYTEANKARINRELDKLLDSHRSKPQNTLDSIGEQQTTYFKNKIGIFSLSSTFESIVMWSHYSNSHRGLCIGYSTEILRNCVEKYMRDNYDEPLFIHLRKIKYDSRYPYIKAIPGEIDVNAFFLRIYTKFILWDYECEWRFAIGVGSKYDLNLRTVQIPVEAIRKVYLGLRIAERDVSELILLLKRAGYTGQIYRTTKERYDYKLNFARIDN